MTPIQELTEYMSKQFLNPNLTLQSRIVKSTFDLGYLYIVAKEGTSKEQWKNKDKDGFCAFTVERTLYLFADPQDADIFARSRGITIDENALVVKSPVDKVSSIIKDQIEKGMLDYVRIYGNSPIYIDLEAQKFIGMEKTLKLEESKFAYVGHIIDVLNTFSQKEKASKYRDFARVENIHECLQEILMQNQISYEEFDTEMDFTPGFTYQFCHNIGGNSEDKETLKKILAYFGLEKYLFFYKAASLTLQQEIKNNRQLDPYEVRKAKVSTIEPFEFLGEERGTYTPDNAYIYRVSFKSKLRDEPLQFLVTDPRNKVIGEQYEIVGLTPIKRESEDSLLDSMDYTDTPKKRSW